MAEPPPNRLFERLGPAEAEQAAEILASCPALEAEAGVPYFRASFASAALIVVEAGFVVARTSSSSRSVITCEAGPGRALLPPREDEVLFALVDSRLRVISAEAQERLVALPGGAQAVLEQFAATLGQTREAIGNFASTRHIDRVRRKLLQLAASYGHVVRDGIRIDFPVSHTVLAEMIGSSRETVTRALDELQRAGFVARHGRSYRLLVAPGSVAEFEV
jgi:CRP-like cAMP-binding protein